MGTSVLITGCSSGIGRATALEFLDGAWTVYATARNRSDIEDLGERGCETAVLDVTEDEQVNAVVDRIESSGDDLACLVNNAGYAQAGAIEEIPPEAFCDQFDVNLHGVHRLVRAALPLMRERGGGTIVNVSSVLGRTALPAMGAYCSAKHALSGLSEALRAEVAPFGIDVVLVEPGFTETRLGEVGEETMRAVADPEGPYARLHENAVAIKDVVMSRPVADEPSTVAESIREAAEADDPAFRIPVGLNGRAVLWSRYLPDRIRDRLLDRLFWKGFPLLR